MSSLTGKSLNPVMNRRSVIASAAGLGAMSILAGCSSNGGDSGSASGDASFTLIIDFIRTPPTFIRTCTDECGNPIP